MNQLATVSERVVMPAPRRVLIAGSGPRDTHLISFRVKWAKEGFHSVTLDIDSRNNPDYCASMTAMGEITAYGMYDVVYCCHALEHLYPHEVPRALAEFYRVLSPGGHVVIMVPDLEDVRATEEPLHLEGDLAITGLHLIYGDARQIEQYPHMAHHSGFVQITLEKALLGAGFADVSVRRAVDYNLIATGKK